MNFDTKHILRWGIPGWYFIINLVIAISFIDGFKWISDNSYLTTSIIVMLMGVPLGYVIYQPYFFLSTKINRDRGIEWNLYLLKQCDDKRRFLSYIYGYYLTVIHGYGSLLSSVIFSEIAFVFTMILYGYNLKVLCLSAINIILFFIVLDNYKHYQNTFDTFVDDILKKNK